VPDWLAAMDDLLCERWLFCIWCGAKGTKMELRTAANGCALTFTLCRACYDADPTEQRRQALVEQHARQRARGGDGRKEQQGTC